MAAPEYVPTEPQQTVRSYSSPPWRPESWYADRPGELDGRQPSGDLLGSPGRSAYQGSGRQGGEL